MSSKSPEPRSIASQLVLLFTLSAALLLVCGLGVLYWIFVRHAYEEDNEVLADKISGLRAELIRTNDPKTLNEELRIVHGGEHLVYWIRVLNSAGLVVAETPGMAEVLPPGAFPKPTGHELVPDHPREYKAGEKLFSMVTNRVDVEGQSYTIQVGQDRSGDEEFIREFGGLLFVVLVLGTLASVVIATKVAKRGLRPLEEMTNSLKEFGPERLHERIPPDGWPRELRPLALAFDDMFDRLEDSFTRLSQFSADLAHELRTPIANIRGEGEVALSRARTSEEYREVIESGIAECERLSRVVDSLLFMARAEAAEERVKQSSFDVREAVEKIAAFFEPVAEEHQVTIRCLGEGKVYADPMLFGRAVTNLVENALRFTPAEGTIEIQVRTDNRSTEVSVQDTGSGIAPEHLPRVFDRFYRADSSRSSQGSGLGLSLVKSIMDLHGGTARIESSGRGTTVTLTFPHQRSR